MQFQFTDTPFGWPCKHFIARFSINNTTVFIVYST